MNNFKCIGGSCEDNCCIGWDVDIDKETYKKYQKVTHPRMKRELDRFISKNPASYDEKIDYAFAMLDSNKHCSFLNADHLCLIHKHLGESYLSNVCGSFPRINNVIDGEMEQSATISCPEVARFVLASQASMEIVESNITKPVSIISFDVKQSDDRFKGKTPSKLRIVRDTCMTFFHGESHNLASINQRLVKLVGFIIETRQLEKQNKLDQIMALADKAINDTENLEVGVLQPKAFISLSEKLIAHLHNVGANDSSRYVTLSEIASKGDYIEGQKRFDAFLSNHPHVMSNYFLNHIFKNLFPFSEGKNIEEAALLLLSRYMMINRELCGLAAMNDAFGMDDVVAYLQSFSKVIEHHKHFEEKTIQVLKAEGYKLEQLIRLIASQ